MKLGFGAAAVMSMAGMGWAQVTQRVSVDSSGAQGDSTSGGVSLAVSADGRYVAFGSTASNLVSGDTNGWLDVFVRDRQSGVTDLVSVDSAGAQSNYTSGTEALSISADGRYVAFDSEASNLVPGDTNGFADFFAHDRQTGATEIISVDSAGMQGNGAAIYGVSISADGRYVAFQSFASNLVHGDTNQVSDIFVRDRQSGTTERVSVSSSGAQGNNGSRYPSISADGRYVAFTSRASNLVPGDSNGTSDVFVRDRQSGTTERVSVDSGGAQGNGASGYFDPVAGSISISADGRYVAFGSDASNLVAGMNSSGGILVHDRQTGATELVSVDSAGVQGNNYSYCPWISADGRHVVFLSHSTNLVPGDTNGLIDAFVHDRQTGLTERANVDSAGSQANDTTQFALTISADGRYVVFDTLATNLVPQDTNGYSDVFVRDLVGGTGFASACDPGASGVISCPCANPPSGPGRGCDNSSGTGGAVLSAIGGAYLSSDSVVLTTSGERATATSVLLQGTAVVANGAVYGQGVRCVGGALVRLYTKAAFGGSITVPNFLTGDAQVSVRSASRGDVIQPGQSRWYLVYYRDPIVLGGCPASATFNATQTGQISWSP